jgi:hypothetical protein
MTDADAIDVVPWEDLGARSAGSAFAVALRDLMLHPRRFYSGVAVSGGLHEPLMFFAVLLGATILLAFLAALAYFGLAAPPSQMGTAGLLALQSAEVRAYELLALPSRALTVTLVLLPEVLVFGAVAMVGLGTLVHLGGRLFGADPWEGAVSVWLYAASAALAPLAVAAAVILVAAGICHATGLTGDGIPASLSVAVRIVCSVGVVTTLILLIVHAALGCIHTLGLESSAAAAATAAGLLTPVLLIALCAIGQATPLGGKSWLVGVAIAAALTVVQVLRARNMGLEQGERPHG